jgi:fatty acid desaturase
VTPTTEIGRPGEEFTVGAGAMLPAEAVRGLSRLSPARATWSLFKSWALIAATAVIAVRWPHPLLVAAAVVVMAAAQHGLAVLTHEAAHHRMYRTRWLNDLVGRLCSWPMSLSMLSYRMIHRVHHNHLYEEVDPDLALIAGYPRGRGYLLRKLAKDLLGITTLKNARYFVRLPAASGAVKDETQSRLRRAARRDRRLAVAVYFGLLAASIATGTWRWFLILWVLPLVTVLQLMLRLRAVCEHGAVTDLSTPLRAARTTLAPLPLRWLLFPHAVFYHVEHHLYPSVPHYRLRDCHQALRAAGLLQGAEVRSLGDTLRRLFAEPLTGTPARGSES